MMNETYIDYNRSFITQSNSDKSPNSPTFLVKSSCKVVDLKTNEEQIFYQGPTMKSENMYVKTGLFKEGKNRYDFTIIYGAKEKLIIRNSSEGNLKLSKKIRQRKSIPNDVKLYFQIRKNIGKFIYSYKDVYQCIKKGQNIIGQIEFEIKRKIIILEFPIETMNCCDKRKLWQVDTGPILFPYFKKENIISKDRFIDNIYLSYISFNSFAMEKKSKDSSSVNLAIVRDVRFGGKILSQNAIVRLITF